MPPGCDHPPGLICDSQGAGPASSSGACPHFESLTEPLVLRQHVSALFVEFLFDGSIVSDEFTS